MFVQSVENVLLSGKLIYVHIFTFRNVDWRPPMPISAGSMRIKKSMADVISMLTQDAEEKNKMNETLQKCIMDAEVSPSMSHLRTPAAQEEANNITSSLVFV